jgi:ComF family protein
MNLSSFIKQLTADSLSLFFPHLCEVCGCLLVRQERIICLSCLVELPRTNYHLQAQNSLEKVFWGRIRMERVAAYFFYSKGSAYQRLLHRLKYEGKKEIGIEMGRLYGTEMKSSGVFLDADFLVPVPLHPQKEKKRGYNQSMQFCLGLSESLGIPINNEILKRVEFTSTQTNKSRIQRWENVNNIFTVTNPDLAKNKQIILVDDVITTGSTIEACAESLISVANCKISVLSMAVA